MIFRKPPFTSRIITFVLNCGRASEARLRGRVLRVVVDGQQRVRVIFDFINDDMKVSQDENPQYAGIIFSELSEEVRAEFMYYEIGCDILNSAPLEDILNIFGRINEL